MLWLDLFRGAAVLVMIETHVINTFLAADHREAGWFAFLNFINGLVAPSFLFIAGFVQGWERRVSPEKSIRYSRRALRLLGLVAIGYALHFPGAALAQHRWDEALRVGTQFDVLQCVGASLGLLLGIGWLANRIPRPWRDAVWWGGVVALAVVAVIAAPTAALWQGGPIAVRAMVNQTTDSLFPLFPWAGFVLLGALAGAWPERPRHECIAGMMGLAVASWVCRGVTFSAASPSFFLERAAWVLMLAALCEWSARSQRPAVVLFAGRNSLTLYVSHLILISILLGCGLPGAGVSLGWIVALIVAVGVVSLAVTAALSRFTARPRGTAPVGGETALGWKAQPGA